MEITRIAEELIIKDKNAGRIMQIEIICLALEEVFSAGNGTITISIKNEGNDCYVSGGKTRTANMKDLR